MVGALFSCVSACAFEPGGSEGFRRTTLIQMSSQRPSAEEDHLPAGLKYFLEKCH